MMKIASRIEALEGKTGTRQYDNYHQLVAREGQSSDSAIDEYGRNKIGPNDFIVVHKIVTPRFDENGDMVFFKDWPENQ